jgi:hypothetical protein
MTWIRNSGGQPLVSAVSANIENFRVVLNLAGVTEYSAYWPYINKFKCTEDLWDVSLGSSGTVAENDSRVNSDYEPAALPNGERWDRLIWNNLEQLRGTNLVKQGVWYLRWDGPTVAAGAIVDVVALDSSVSGQSSTGNLTQFTIGTGATNLYVRVRNNTGSTASFTNIRLLHSAHQTSFDAGEVFDPDWLASLQSYPYRKAIRYLEFFSTNFSTVTNAADLTPLTHASYCRSGKGCPPEIIGKLSKKLNTSPWITMPYLATDTCLTTICQKIKDEDPSATYMVFCEGINEFWNSQFPGANWAATTGSASITIVDGSGNAGDTTPGSGDRWACGAAHFSLRAWTAAEAVFGPSRVIRCMGGQPTTGNFAQIYWYRDTSNTLFGGTRLGLLLTSPQHALITTLYWNWQSTASFPGRTPKFMILNDFGTQTNAQVRDDLITNLDDTLPNVITFVNTARTRGVTARVEMYEGNIHDFFDSHSGATDQPANFPGTVDTVTNSIEFSSGDIPFHTDGDRYNCQNGGLAAGHTGGINYWARKITATNKLRFYTSQALYDADSANIGTGSITLNAGTYSTIVNRTKFARMADKANSVMQGSDGATVFQHAVEAVLLDSSVNCRSFSIFAHTSSPRSGEVRFADTFANTNANGGITAADTPIIDYLQSLNTPP